MEITIFKDIKDTSQPFYRDVAVVLKRIGDGSSKEKSGEKLSKLLEKALSEGMQSLAAVRVSARIVLSKASVE